MTLETKIHYGGIVGESPAMRKVYELIDKVAPSSAAVLILGESGVGKELVARAIHKQSGRTRFVPVNCAAIPHETWESEMFGHAKGAFTGASYARKGQIAYADGGTLFLDQVEELPIREQAKLLRVVEDRQIKPLGQDGYAEVNFRLVSASNIDLYAAVGQGRFRQDLYHRLGAIKIEIPPLRERASDIGILIGHFLRHYATSNQRCVESFTPDELKTYMSHPWHGNVRELQNAIQKIVISGADRIAVLEQATTNKTPIGIAEIVSDDEMKALLAILMGPDGRGDGASMTLPHHNSPNGDGIFVSLKQLQIMYVRDVLGRVGGNKSAAAAILGISRRTLRKKLRELSERGT